MKRKSRFDRITSAIIITVMMVLMLLPTVAFANSANAPYNDASNFVVENGVLTNYMGTGGNLEVVIPDGVTEIASFAFINHDGIKSVTIPDSVAKVNLGAFRGCGNITDIYIGSGVRYLHEPDGVRTHIDPFYELPSMQSYHVSANNPYFKDIDGVLFTADGKTLVRYPQGRSGDYAVPNGTTAIRTLAFAGTSSLGTLKVPGTVSEIVIVTFENIGMGSTIILEEGVKKINQAAFLNCYAKSIVVPSSVTQIHEYNVFGSNMDHQTIYGNPGSAIETHCKQNNLTFSTGNPFDATTAPNLHTASPWAYDSINSAVNKGFVPTSLQDNYTNVITRQEFCTMAVRFVEYKTGKTYTTILSEKGLSIDLGVFTDTDDRYILAAYALGITNGTSDTTFSPNDNFTREQAATMIMNVCNILDIGTSGSDAGYVDSGNISSWAVDGVNFCKTNGYMSGTGNNHFSPQGLYTRQESIATFDRIH